MSCSAVRIKVGTHRQLTLITYIPKSIKNQKRQTPEKGLALLKKDITNNLEPQKPVIYSRKYKSHLH